MKDFKKAILASISVLLTLVILSSVILASFSNRVTSADLELRNRLAGSVDCFFVGASHCQQGIDTIAFDEGFGCNSYNLAADAMTINQKKYLLEHELARNNVNTVILEVSYDTMRTTPVSDYTNNSVDHIFRLDNLKDRLKFFFFETTLENKIIVYSMWVVNCTKAFVYSVFNRPFIDEVTMAKAAELKGSRSLGCEYEGMPAEDVESSYHSLAQGTDGYLEETIRGTEELIQMAKDHGARVIVIVIPVSDSYIWTHSDMDEFHDWTQQFCDRNEVEFYDFSLYKEKSVLFPDGWSFSYDNEHLGGEAPANFSRLLADVINMVDNGMDISDLFYASYEEVTNNINPDNMVAAS